MTSWGGEDPHEVRKRRLAERMRQEARERENIRKATERQKQQRDAEKGLKPGQRPYAGGPNHPSNWPGAGSKRPVGQGSKGCAVVIIGWAGAAAAVYGMARGLL